MMDAKKVAKIKKIVIRKLDWLTMLVFLGIVAYCGYLWYGLVYNSQLSDSERQAYVDTKEKDVKFNQRGFDSVLEQIEQRKIQYTTPIENVPDIFRLKQ